MHIWLIHLGELLPIDGNVRLSRYGILANMLASRGHNVTRWTSTFVHGTKTYRYHKDTTIFINNNYIIRLLHSSAYKEHISIRRVLFHYNISRRFLYHASSIQSPDIILCSMPTPEMCSAALRYGKARGIPVIIDIRDLWPEALLDLLTPPLRFFSRLVLVPAFLRNQAIFKNATAIVAICEEFLRWGLNYARRDRLSSDRVFYMAYSPPTLTDHTLQRYIHEWHARGVDPNAFICCFAGTIGNSFDLKTVIEAAQILTKYHGHLNLQFVLCGNGERLSQYREFASNTDNVFFPGWVNPDELSALFTMSHIGLIPYHESFRSAIPNKLMDYFAHGLPVIHSGKFDLFQLVNNNQLGYFYIPENSKSLVSQILKLLDNRDETNSISYRAKQFFHRYLCSESVYHDFIDYLESIYFCNEIR